jgi:hypothetical protein
MSRLSTRWIGIVIAIAAIAIPVQAQNVLTIRVESLDALIEDVETIAVALGQEPGSGAAMVQMVGSQLGLHDLDMIDGKNPLVVTLPLQGMMLGQQGFVGAFPVSDVDAAVAAMKAAQEGVTIDENGLLHIPMGEQPEILLLPSDGYLIYGQNANLVGGFDPDDLLSGAHLPPGTIAAEFNVDSMRAMIGMTLEGARQSIAGAVTQGAEQGGESIDAETAEALTGTIVEWMQALVANTRAVQLSVQVTDRHLVVHNHYLPVADSTLGGLLKAQKGGMPDVARLLDGKNAGMTMVANMHWTDEAIGALESFMGGYSVLLQQMMKGQEDAAGLAELMPGLMEQYAGMAKCMRGDMAQVVDMSDGLSVAHVSGLKDSDECRAMDKKMGEIMAGLPEEIGSFMTYSPGALSHGGLQVARTSVQMDKIMVMPEQAGAEVGQAMSAMFGDDGFITYMATSDELWLGTGGAGADDAMRTMIDRVQKSKSGQGIEASAFAPFEVNAGAYFSMDFGRLFAGLKGIVPEAEASEMAEVQEIMAALGAMTAALELQPDALALKFAMSTSGLAKIAELVGEEAAAEMEHGEGHDSN